ncbi:hypothetical protein [Stutzerimonas stutzeri]|uniref:hypothetical protein n=1 Tax=Stutzerimonas stutzeri TaxID=316 RepID=UPI002231A054|nr:hypothetical protein [Stutzerimonas stutzeri]
MFHGPLEGRLDEDGRAGCGEAHHVLHQLVERLHRQVRCAAHPTSQDGSTTENARPA